MRGLLKRVTAFDEAMPETVYPTGGPHQRPEPLSLIVVPNPCPLPSTQTDVPKRRPRPVRIGRLYPEKVPEPQMHAKALLAFIQEECPQLTGTYVPCADLAKSYEEFAAAEGWTTRGWTTIARQLGGMTIKKSVKRGGRRFTAYRIPRS